MKKEKEIMKSWFTENVKKPRELCIAFTIDGETFHLFTKNTLIGNSGALCHITSDDNGLYNVIKINKSILGIEGNIFQEKQAVCESSPA